MISLLISLICCLRFVRTCPSGCDQKGKPLPWTWGRGFEFPVLFCPFPGGMPFVTPRQSFVTALAASCSACAEPSWGRSLPAVRCCVSRMKTETGRSSRYSWGRRDGAVVKVQCSRERGYYITSNSYFGLYPKRWKTRPKRCLSTLLEMWYDSVENGCGGWKNRCMFN